MTHHFDDPATCQMWDSYFAELDQLIEPLGQDGRELRDDLELHLLEGLGLTAGRASTPAQLRDALAKLGRPIEILRPVLADSYLSQGAQNFNPVTISKGLFHTLLAGGSRVLAGFAFAIGYLFIAIFVAIALAKPFWDEHVGVFRYPDGTMAAGFVARSAAGEELLGWWFIPVALTLAALIYVLLTKGLRRLL
ncbi:MAG: hypothetical protein WBA51_12075 [Erythrobacter sp.]